MSLRLDGVEVADEALVSIVRGAVASVDGARLDRPSRISRVLPGRRGAVDWRVEGGALAVGVDLAVAYGVVLPDVARRVRRQVADDVSGMTGMPVRSVDVTVTGLDS
jgi:uncharacterized alkaline shock family protein YloU